jgi:hypothetical protein
MHMTCLRPSDDTALQPWRPYHRTCSLRHLSALLLLRDSGDCSQLLALQTRVDAVLGRLQGMAEAAVQSCFGATGMVVSLQHHAMGIFADHVHMLVHDQSSQSLVATG